MFLYSSTSLSFGYSFNETYHVSECWFIQKISSFFSLRVHCAALFWNLGFFISQIMFLVFQWTKATPCASSFFDDHVATLMCLHPVMNERLLIIIRSLKFHHVLIFLAGSSSVLNMVEEYASPLTHIWLIESEALTCLSQLVMIERVGVRDSLAHCHNPVILANCYRPLTVKCNRVSYFFVTTHTYTCIYIYIYIYIIIIMPRHQLRSPWPSPATLLYRLSVLIDFQGCILYQHRAVVYRFCPCSSMWRGLQEYLHKYIYIYMCARVCVCVCVHTRVIE